MSFTTPTNNIPPHRVATPNNIAAQLQPVFGSPRSPTHNRRTIPLTREDVEMDDDTTEELTEDFSYEEYMEDDTGDAETHPEHADISDADSLQYASDGEVEARAREFRRAGGPPVRDDLNRDIGLDELEAMLDLSEANQREEDRFYIGLYRDRIEREQAGKPADFSVLARTSRDAIDTTYLLQRLAYAEALVPPQTEPDPSPFSFSLPAVPSAEHDHAITDPVPIPVLALADPAPASHLDAAFIIDEHMDYDELMAQRRSRQREMDGALQVLFP